MSKNEFDNKKVMEFPIDKLQEQVISFKKELFNLRFQQTLGELKNTRRFAEVKKIIARIKTELTKRSMKG